MQRSSHSTRRNTSNSFSHSFKHSSASGANLSRKTSFSALQFSGTTDDAQLMKEHISQYTLTIKDPILAREYRRQWHKKIYYIAIFFTIVRALHVIQGVISRVREQEYEQGSAFIDKTSSQLRFLSGIMNNNTHEGDDEPNENNEKASYYLHKLQQSNAQDYQISTFNNQSFEREKRQENWELTSNEEGEERLAVKPINKANQLNHLSATEEQPSELRVLNQSSIIYPPANSQKVPRFIQQIGGSNLENINSNQKANSTVPSGPQTMQMPAAPTFSSQNVSNYSNSSKTTIVVTTQEIKQYTSYYIGMTIALIIQTMLVCVLGKLKDQKVLEFAIPIWISINFIQFDPISQQTFQEYSLGVLQNLILWYMHCGVSNLNWIVSSIGYIFAQTYQAIFFSLKLTQWRDETYDYSLQYRLRMYGNMLFGMIAYIILAYQADKLKKSHFLIKYKHQKERQSFIELLGEFPGCSFMLIEQQQTNQFQKCTSSASYADKSHYKNNQTPTSNETSEKGLLAKFNLFGRKNFSKQLNSSPKSAKIVGGKAEFNALDNQYNKQRQSKGVISKQNVLSKNLPSSQSPSNERYDIEMSASQYGSSSQSSGEIEVQNRPQLNSQQFDSQVLYMNDEMVNLMQNSVGFIYNEDSGKFYPQQHDKFCDISGGFNQGGYQSRESIEIMINQTNSFLDEDFSTSRKLIDTQTVKRGVSSPTRTGRGSRYHSNQPISRRRKNPELGTSQDCERADFDSPNPRGGEGAGESLFGKKRKRTSSLSANNHCHQIIQPNSSTTMWQHILQTIKEHEILTAVGYSDLLRERKPAFQARNLFLQNSKELSAGKFMIERNHGQFEEEKHITDHKANSQNRKKYFNSQQQDHSNFSSQSEDALNIQAAATQSIKQPGPQQESDEQNPQKTFELTQREVKFCDQNCRLVVVRDISSLIKNEQLRSVERLSDIMIASTSHDMRTPLNTISSMLYLIGQRINELDISKESRKSLNPRDQAEHRELQQMIKWVRIASNSTHLLSFLVSDTLDYFQIKSGKFQPQPVPTNLFEIVENAFDLISIQMGQKNLQKIVDIDEVLQQSLFICDKQRMSQVIVNLLSNAIKFTFEGFIKISISVATSADVDCEHGVPPEDGAPSSNTDVKRMLKNSINQRSSMKIGTDDTSQPKKLIKLRFSVSDSGIGIKEQDFSRLFKVFGKIQHASMAEQQANPQGIGLGLTICNKILNQFHSDLELRTPSQLNVRSRYGEGSEFYFLMQLPWEKQKSQQPINQPQLNTNETRMNSFQVTAPQAPPISQIYKEKHEIDDIEAPSIGLSGKLIVNAKQYDSPDFQFFRQNQPEEMNKFKGEDVHLYNLDPNQSPKNINQENYRDQRVNLMFNRLNGNQIQSGILNSNLPPHSVSDVIFNSSGIDEEELRAEQRGEPSTHAAHVIARDLQGSSKQEKYSINPRQRTPTLLDLANQGAQVVSSDQGPLNIGQTIETPSYGLALAQPSLLGAPDFMISGVSMGGGGFGQEINRLKDGEVPAVAYYRDESPLSQLANSQLHQDGINNGKGNLNQKQPISKFALAQHQEPQTTPVFTDDPQNNDVPTVQNNHFKNLSYPFDGQYPRGSDELAQAVLGLPLQDNYQFSNVMGTKNPRPLFNSFQGQGVKDVQSRLAQTQHHPLQSMTRYGGQNHIHQGLLINSQSVNTALVTPNILNHSGPIVGPSIQETALRCLCPPVLIVDDNDFNILSLQTILEVEYKISIHSAYHGEQAVKMVKERLSGKHRCSADLCNSKKLGYTLIFMDISMPVMDGYQATLAIREIEKNFISQSGSQKQLLLTPSNPQKAMRQFISGLSAHATDTFKKKALDVNMDEFMTKPLDKEHLKEVLIKSGVLSRLD